MKIVTFVAASSGSGKTTLIEKIVGLLKARGLRIAVIKHASEGFDLDQPGKDSWKFREAGADTVILAAPGRVALMKNIEGEPGIEELRRMAGDADIAICEGFKQDAKNKIEVFRHAVSGERPLCLDDPSYLALVTDRRCTASIPQFDINDAESVAQFLIDTIVGRCPAVPTNL